jgi:hypothetical protein
MTMTQQTDGQPPLSPIVAAVFTRMFEDTASTTTNVIEMFKRDEARLKAELWLIRDQVGRLLEGPWMPTSHALMEALYPSRDAVEAAVNDGGDF